MSDNYREDEDLLSDDELQIAAGGYDSGAEVSGDGACPVCGGAAEDHMGWSEYPYEIVLCNNGHIFKVSHAGSDHPLYNI